MDADDLIARLDLKPHPEGGHYRQTWIATNDGRPTGTCIYFLLREGERSHWHRVDATEIWHFYTGSPLVLSVSDADDGPRTDHVLGPSFERGQSPQVIVPSYHWQSAKCTGRWTLVGCTVSPGFQFTGFELAAPEFDID